ncbi:pentapeptide repeat-containing protein [Microseira sp. BLCC-F43]|uniref:nSTAND1 domain-containing NTPase n=1 Tax=Microseira sp. BLCC-F43 TaxID=3153602 RepID=UPI0035B6D55D
MTAALESSLVRIYSNRGSVIGAGFLVSQKRILTCAHVVADALGIDRKTVEMPDQKVSLDFPILAAKQLLTARVIFWRPVNPDEFAEDIAGLELENSAPDAARPAQLVTSEELWGHRFRVLGFPAGQHNGVWASGELRGKLASGWVQLEDVKQGGYRLEPGFSGAPIWDEQLQGVAGMAVANETKRPETKAAFIIPANVLIKAWPELGEQAIPACPYRGLLAFREQDAKFFFGREKFTQQLVTVVQRQQLVAVIGPSGSGKSSVVFAGLIPKLREEGNWLIESFRPQSEPFYGLASALVRWLKPELDEIQQPGRAKELMADIKQGLTLPQVVASILERYPGKRLLLVVDQFEELYTLCRDIQAQQQFVDALLAAVESASRTVTLVLTLRADFYSYVVNYPPLGEALNKYPAQNLTLMKAEEMQAAIELPAEKMNVKLEEKLTERILNDVKQEPGNLPLLEFALTQLWEKQSRGILTHQAYSEIGGVAKALSNHAEAVYGKLSVGEQKQAQRIFLELVRLGEGTQDSRRMATRGEVGEECWELIRRRDGLADARLVVTGRNEATGEETVEVVHEALIREWDLLRQWINKNRKKLIQKREIEDAAKRWRDRGKAKDYLLVGKVLAEARVFQKEEGGNLKLSDLAKVFIRQSLGQRRSNRIKFVGLGLIVPLGLAVFLGIVAEKEIRIRRLWNTVDAAKGEGKVNSSARILALQELVKLGVSLNNIDLRGADLSEANLRGANLSGATLTGANLTGADLTDADLTGADLSRANLSDADLSIAKLGGAKLGGADLSSTDLSDAKLSEAHLSGANLSDASLSNADLSRAYLSGADLTDAYLSGADLRSANLILADLTRADLSGADLSGANLSPANLSRADLSDADLRCVEVDGNPHCTNFTNAKNLTPEQVKSAKNWQQAEYDEEFRKKLGLKEKAGR